MPSPRRFWRNIFMARCNGSALILPARRSRSQTDGAWSRAFRASSLRRRSDIPPNFHATGKVGFGGNCGLYRLPKYRRGPTPRQTLVLSAAERRKRTFALNGLADWRHPTISSSCEAASGSALDVHLLGDVTAIYDEFGTRRQARVGIIVDDGDQLGNCCCAIKRAGSSRRSAPMTTASTPIPIGRSRTGTKTTGVDRITAPSESKPPIDAEPLSVRPRQVGHRLPWSPTAQG